MRGPAFIVTIIFLLIVNGYDSRADSKMAASELINDQGKTVGYATLVEGPDGVEIAVQVHDTPQGLHGFHIHAVGKCETPDFKSAGGHFDPHEKKHGLKNPEGPHVGDMPNLLVGPDGTASAVGLAPLATLGNGKNSLFHEGGTALVMHAGRDDQITDPAGDAGARIACGVIKRVR
ncbi:MAG: superoxide dismutase family protein [Thermodesulfobacteriota bacterium]